MLRRLLPRPPRDVGMRGSVLLLACEAGQRRRAGGRV